MTPFQALYGRPPPPLIRVGQGQTTVDSLKQALQARDDIIDELKLQLLRAQQHMNLQTDKKRRHIEYTVGDLVFVKLQPYRQKSLARRMCEKLAARFYGPYPVLQRVGPVAYKLQLPTSSQVHPVFHVSQLKKAEGTSHAPNHIPPHINSEMELVAQPQWLLGVRKVQQGQEQRTEVLIKWAALPESEATWEDYQLLKDHFPDFHLEDKVNLWGGSNVMHQSSKPPILITYHRRTQATGETGTSQQAAKQ